MIGVFDSGYGGLTILRELKNQLPQYDYLYLGDNAHAPYGTKDADEVYQYTTAGVKFLFDQGAQIVILGCNTASVSALRRIQTQWLKAYDSQRRVLGIVVPTIEQITGANWRHQEPITTPIKSRALTVGVLATPLTVETNVYTTEIHKRNQSVQVIEQACPELAELIEAGNDQAIDQKIKQYCTELLMKAPGRISSVLLGCTHYELVRSKIESALPPHTKLFSQPFIVAQSLTAYLQRHGALEKKLSRNSQLSAWTSGESASVSRQSVRYFGEPLSFRSW